MPGGNVLMVGLGGIGRRSAVKLAACMFFTLSVFYSVMLLHHPCRY